MEDDTKTAEIIGLYLRKSGYDVTIAHDGKSGLRAALEDTPDLVVLDLLLPALDGLQVCHTLLAQSPVDMIWEMRLVEASYRLASRAGTISEVAYSVGFKSVSHFGKRFKAHFGTSPRAYIDQQAPLG